MNRLILISYCCLLKKMLVVITNLTNPKSASDIVNTSELTVK